MCICFKYIFFATAVSVLPTPNYGEILLDDPDTVETACDSYEILTDPTLCQNQGKQETQEDEHSILSSIGILKLKNAIFPELEDHWDALVVYDEPLYPVALGPSIYLFICLSVIIGFYIFKCIQRYCDGTRERMLLRPHTAKIPHLPIYWLQQNEREKTIKREVRNTWAWMAKRYLLSPNDPLLDGIDETLSNTTWDDFKLPKQSTSVIPVVTQSFTNLLDTVKKRNKTGGEPETHRKWSRLANASADILHSPPPPFDPHHRPKSKSKNSKGSDLDGIGRSPKTVGKIRSALDPIKKKSKKGSGIDKRIRSLHPPPMEVEDESEASESQFPQEGNATKKRFGSRKPSHAGKKRKNTKPHHTRKSTSKKHPKQRKLSRKSSHPPKSRDSYSSEDISDERRPSKGEEGGRGSSESERSSRSRKNSQPKRRKGSSAPHPPTHKKTRSASLKRSDSAPFLSHPALQTKDKAKKTKSSKYPGAGGNEILRKRTTLVQRSHSAEGQDPRRTFKGAVRTSRRSQSWDLGRSVVEDEEDSSGENLLSFGRLITQQENDARRSQPRRGFREDDPKVAVPPHRPLQTRAAGQPTPSRKKFQASSSSQLEGKVLVHQGQDGIVSFEVLKSGGGLLHLKDYQLTLNREGDDAVIELKKRSTPQNEESCKKKPWKP